ncbi:D-ribulose kinase [Glycine soja]|nr:D-ribulose kinase [Glycine soja]
MSLGNGNNKKVEMNVRGAGERFAGFAIIDKDGTIQADAKREYPLKSGESHDWVRSWKETLFSLLQDVPLHLRKHVVFISTDGTSATALIVDRLAMILSGTTDSIAAFLAARATQPGKALLNYSATQELRILGLGCTAIALMINGLLVVLQTLVEPFLDKLFTDEQLEKLSEQINPSQPSLLDYYPLAIAGEGFPVADPDLAPRLLPRPENDVECLHGILESIARIEAKAYGLLKELGATQVDEIFHSRWRS